MNSFPMIASGSGRVPRYVRTCANCSHCATRREMVILDVQVCAEPRVVDRVTGKPVYTCKTMRHEHMACGPNARLHAFASEIVVEKVVEHVPEKPAPFLTLDRIRELFGKPILAAREPVDAFEVLTTDKAA